MKRGWLASLARRTLMDRLARMEGGRIRLREGGAETLLGRGGRDLPVPSLQVNDPRFWSDLLLGGSLGAAESYGRGRWESDDLTTLLRVAARGEDAGGEVDGATSRLARGLHTLTHRLRRNTRPGSRRNISAHYDLGNDFFATFLDETMTYSCGIFPRPDASLAEASRAKLERVCQLLELQPGHTLLEIGTGWGSLALHAATRHGCQVVTTTISRQQHAEATRRVREAGLQDRITVLAADYRDLPALLDRRFDRIASIEMIEAVGHDFLEGYFQVCDRLLAPDGAMVLQAIVMDDARYDAYRRSADFIQSFIFPGGCLPSRSAMAGAVGRATGLRIQRTDDITPHYPPTLRAWRNAFRTRRDDLRAMGYDERLLRLWDYYFCYCEAGFLERRVGDVQWRLVAPAWRAAASQAVPA